jgi:hypothetical protein
MRNSRIQAPDLFPCGFRQGICQPSNTGPVNNNSGKGWTEADGGMGFWVGLETFKNQR